MGHTFRSLRVPRSCNHLDSGRLIRKTVVVIDGENLEELSKTEIKKET